MEDMPRLKAYQPHASLHRKPGIYEVSGIEWYDEPHDGYTGEVFLKGFSSSEYIEDVTLLQPIGLCDIDGQHIYVGDIVERKRPMFKRSGAKNGSTIEHIVVKRINKGGHNGFNLASAQHVRIIGNQFVTI